MKKSILVFWASLFFGFYSVGNASPEPETPPSDENISVIKVKSVPKERATTLTIKQKTWTRQVKTAVFCSKPAVTSIKLAKLWMTDPSHNHGSTPTKIKKMDGRDDCFVIEKINFTMLGDWEIRVTTDDNDSAVFKMKVVESMP